MLYIRVVFFKMYVWSLVSDFTQIIILLQLFFFFKQMSSQ